MKYKTLFIPFLCLTTATLIASTTSETCEPAAPYHERCSLSGIIHLKVAEIIHNAQIVPGLSGEEFSVLKEDIGKVWNSLFAKGVFEVSGTDQQIRPSFVALQAIIEHVLASELNNEIATLLGIIHTPMPATPLCTQGEISKELIDSSIENDPLRLLTVKARTTIVRDFLQKGGILHIAYPHNGLSKRTAIQQEIYRNELLNFPGRLFDNTLDCEVIPSDMIGATYLFRDQSGKIFVFSIKMSQANAPKELGNYALWFGSLNHAAIDDRVNRLRLFLNGCDSNLSHIINKEIGFSPL